MYAPRANMLVAPCFWSLHPAMVLVASLASARLSKIHCSSKAHRQKSLPLEFLANFQGAATIIKRLRYSMDKPSGGND